MLYLTDLIVYQYIVINRNLAMGLNSKPEAQNITKTDEFLKRKSYARTSTVSVCST